MFTWGVSWYIISIIIEVEVGHMVITHFLTGNAHPSTMQVRKREGNRETKSLPEMDWKRVDLVFFSGMPAFDH